MTALRRLDDRGEPSKRPMETMKVAVNDTRASRDTNGHCQRYNGHATVTLQATTLEKTVKRRRASLTSLQKMVRHDAEAGGRKKVHGYTPNVLKRSSLPKSTA